MPSDVRRILVVDDEEDMRELARFSLEHVEGWQVIVAESGRDGVRAAQGEHPDAILLDVMMTDMDGRTALRHLREDEQTASIPVIFLTGKAHTAEARQLGAMGVAGVIAKPFDPFELPRRVSEALDWAV